MKRLAIFLISLSTLTTSWAGINAKNGIYLGGQLDFIAYQAVTGSSISSGIIPVDGYIRPYIGYRFTDYVAIEGGYNNLVNQHHNARTDDAGNHYGPDHYKLYAFDLAGKAIYPFANGLSIFGKAGLALVHQDVYNQMFIDWVPSADTKENKILPLIGAGISYNFTQHIAADLSYTHIQGSHPIGNIEILGLGLAYTF